MFLKSNKRFLRKNILRFMKQPKGSIAIIVLIIGIAVVLAIGALSAYMIKDIKFTQLDEQKLKALNIAEAGISYMFLYISEDLKKDNSLQIPYDSTPISFDSSPSELNVLGGSYHVECTKTKTGPYTMPTYIIESEGMEKDGQKRTVRVTIVIPSQYDFIYSVNSLSDDYKINGITKIIGPFMTKFDLDVSGNANFFAGNPIIVNGNLYLSGSSAIGTSTDRVDLYLGGQYFEKNSVIPLYSMYPKPPDSSSYLFINNFFNKTVTLPDIAIDPSFYINSMNGAETVYGLTIYIDGTGKGTFAYKDVNNVIIVTTDPIGSGFNKLSFSSDKTTLEISGNIIVEGDISIGEKNNDPPIKYSGKGNLFSTGSIYLNSLVTPKIITSFPATALLSLISMNNINFNESGNTSGTHDNPDYALVAISQNLITVQNYKYIRGNIIGGQLDIGNNSTIDFEPNIPSGDLPLPGHFILSQKWEEIPNS